MTGSGPPARPPRPRHPDRVGLQRWLLAATAVTSAVAAGTAGTTALARTSGRGATGLAVGVVVGALAVVGLRSLSIRLVARVVLAVSAALIVRYGTLRGSLTGGSQEVLAWLAAAVATFVLTDRVGTDAQPALRTGADAPPAPPPAAVPGVPAVAGAPPGAIGRAQAPRTGRTTVLAVLAVLVAVLVITPLALPRMSSSAAPGDGPQLPEDGEGSTALRATDSLDMTGRPDLTDEVVFRVTTDRPAFWRGETFDRWDGRRWTRSEPDRSAVVDGVVEPAADDLGASGPDRFTQRFRVEATYADVVFGAPSVVSVDAGRVLAQRADGTLTTAGVALGRGATYEVTSRRPVLTEEALRAAEGPIPPAIAARYAAPPTITDRVQEAAVEATADATTTYDRIIALERWMGGRTEYSLDAPLSPEGVDVVDHFLFESRQGWCEQVASSLVVLARANGIPARLVTGFVPGERDRVTGAYVVRARDAHAWAEVWFPELGWVPFDPTADVPLAATASTDRSWGRWLLDHALVIGLVAAAAVAVGWPLARHLRRRRARRAGRPATWAGIADRRLVALGERAGRPRADGETATAYAAALADRYRAPALAGVGVAVDDSLFAPEPPDGATRTEVDRVLAGAEAAEVPEPEPVG